MEQRDESGDESGSETGGGVSGAPRSRLSVEGGLRTALTTGALALLATGTTAAMPATPLQTGGSGLCSLPGGSTALPTVILLLQGTLFLLGIYKVSSGSASEGGDGDYGTSSGRKKMALGVGVMLVGILLPQLATFVLEMFGSSAGGMGLGCAF